MPIGISLFVSVSIFLAIAVQERIVPTYVDWLNKKIKSKMLLMMAAHKEDTYSKILTDEIRPFELVGEKKQELYIITKIIGYFEFFLFFTSTLILFSLQAKGLDILQTLGVLISGWLAIKIFGSYQQWSGPVFGRATFYVFLTGSLLNILFAVISPIIIFVTFFML
jgi:hypothetical protein